MLKEKITNPELKRYVALKWGKYYFDECTDEEIESIEELSISSKLINGKNSEIPLDVITLFPKLKYLNITRYNISQENLDSMMSIPSLEVLTFYNSEFSKTNFSKYEDIKCNINFKGCVLPEKFPLMEYVHVEGSEINQKSIDFSKVKDLVLLNCNIRNAFSIKEYEQIESVNLDGSKIYDENGSIIYDIEVPDRTRYSHTDELYLYDNRRNYDIDKVL